MQFDKCEYLRFVGFLLLLDLGTIVYYLDRTGPVFIDLDPKPDWNDCFYCFKGVIYISDARHAAILFSVCSDGRIQKVETRGETRAHPSSFIRFRFSVRLVRSVKEKQMRIW